MIEHCHYDNILNQNKCLDAPARLGPRTGLATWLTLKPIYPAIRHMSLRYTSVMTPGPACPIPSVQGDIGASRFLSTFSLRSILFQITYLAACSKPHAESLHTFTLL